MNPYAQSLLTVLSYAVVGGLAVIGSKYGVIDSTTTTLILGGVLTHFGFIGAPATASAIKGSGNGSTPVDATTLGPKG